MKIDEQLVTRILSLLSHGLTKGLGVQKEGEMCIEAAICFAFGLPHSDNPPCVGKEVRMAKITLNDCRWSSNKARAEGMKKLAIAQLGSDKLDQEEFRNRLKLNSMRKILPFLIQKHFDENKDEKLLPWKHEFETLEVLDNKLLKEFYKEYYHYDYYYDYYYYYYYYYHYDYSYNYYYDYYYRCDQSRDEFLLLVANTILQTLIEMNCEGCKYLYLIP